MKQKNQNHELMVIIMTNNIILFKKLTLNYVHFIFIEMVCY